MNSGNCSVPCVEGHILKERKKVTRSEYICTWGTKCVYPHIKEETLSEG